MLSKSDISLINSLDKKKFRHKYGCFAAEGAKAIGELAECFPCRLLVTNEQEQHQLPATLLHSARRVELVDMNFNFSKISFLQTPRPFVAIFDYELSPEEAVLPKGNDLSLFLDGIQDPGNLGTILRTADWFGIRHVYLAEGTADPFQPKVVQATMGALAHVGLEFVQRKTTFLEDYLAEGGCLIGGCLEGENLYTSDFNSQQPTMLAIGNEGNGLSREVLERLTHKVHVPSFGNQTHTESLNAAIATAIILSELKRRG